MEEEDDEGIISEFRWNLKMLLRLGYPKGIRLDLLESTYHRYYDKVIAPNLILANTERWEDVFKHPTLAITFTTSEKINNTGDPGLENYFLIKLRFADNEEDHGQLADVLNLVSYPNYVKAKRTVEPTNPTVEMATSSTGTRTGEASCHVPTSTVSTPTVSTSTVSTSTVSTSTVPTSTVPTSTVPTLGSPIQINGVRSASIGSSALARTRELNLDSQTQRLFPGPGVITRRRSALFSSNVIPVATRMAQSAELVTTVVRPASEPEHSQSAGQPVVLPVLEPERSPIIVKVESARVNPFHIPTTQPIQDFIDLTQDSDDEGENEANHSSSTPGNAGNSTSIPTPERSSNIHGPSGSDNVSFATPSHAESNCTNIVHVVVQPVLPVEFVRVKPERFKNVDEQTPVSQISAVENAGVSCRLNVEQNQNNGDRQGEPVMSLPSVVVKVETNQNENDLAAEAVPVPTSRDDQGQVGVWLNIREPQPQPPLYTEIRPESRPIKTEDMSAAEIPLGNTMGAETEETSSLPPPYSAMVNSGTYGDQNLIPTSANTVMNSVEAMKLPPTPPSTVVTALESNSQPSTSIKTEQITTSVETSPMASTAFAATTTLTEVSTTTIDSGEFVPDNMNSPATQLPVSAIFSRTPLGINIDHEFNIFRSQSGDLNKNQPTLLQGTNNSSSNDSPTPEQVITQIETLKTTGGQKRTDETVAQFRTFQCHSIRVGSYSRAMENSHNSVTISDIGILFDLSHSQTDAVIRFAVPADQVLNVTAHCSAKLPLLVVTTTPRYAVWLRGRLGMTDDPAMPNCFCPLKGGESQKYLILKVDKFSIMDIVFINRIYMHVLIELDYEKAKSLETNLEDHTQGNDQVGLQLNNREPQPPISTENPSESRPIELEDMSAAGIPLGNMMGAETQETAVGNSQTPVNLNLTPAAVNTVKNSGRAKADSDPDWEPGPGPSRNRPRSSGSGTIKRPTTAGTPRTPTKRVRKDYNASGQSSDVGPSHNLENDSRDVEGRITGLLEYPMSDAQFEEIVTSIAGLPPIEQKLTKWLLNTHVNFNTPNDWIAVPVSTTTQLPEDEHANEIPRGFYKSTHGPKKEPCTEFLNYDGCWVPCGIKNFQLPKNTIVFGEFVERITSEVTTFEVIDCACLLGRDVRGLSIEERRNKVKVYCESNLNKLPRKTNIRLKQFYPMTEMNKKIFNRFETFTVGIAQGYRGLPDPLRKGDYNTVVGIVFFQSTFQSSSANFTLAMDNRYIWLFESDLAFAATNSISIQENDQDLALWHFLEKIRASRETDE